MVQLNYAIVELEEYLIKSPENKAARLQLQKLQEYKRRLINHNRNTLIVGLETDSRSKWTIHDSLSELRKKELCRTSWFRCNKKTSHSET